MISLNDIDANKDLLAICNLDIVDLYYEYTG